MKSTTERRERETIADRLVVDCTTCTAGPAPCEHQSDCNPGSVDRDLEKTETNRLHNPLQRACCQVCSFVGNQPGEPGQIACCLKPPTRSGFPAVDADSWCSSFTANGTIVIFKAATHDLT